MHQQQPLTGTSPPHESSEDNSNNNNNNTGGAVSPNTTRKKSAAEESGSGGASGEGGKKSKDKRRSNSCTSSPRSHRSLSKKKNSLKKHKHKHEEQRAKEDGVRSSSGTEGDTPGDAHSAKQQPAISSSSVAMTSRDCAQPTPDLFEQNMILVLVRCQQNPITTKEYGDDFTEVSLPADYRQRSLAGLKRALAAEFRVQEHQIARLRKLPNIAICRDEHVFRLRGGEELEIVLDVSAV